MGSRMMRGVVTVVAMGMTLVGSNAGAEDAAPPLTPEQQEKLSKIQAMFLPGGKVTSSGFGIDKALEFCGAAIALEVHPSTVAYDNPAKTWDRSNISTMCHGAAGAVVYMCGYNEEDDPVIKEMIRTNVKRIVCKATRDAAEVGAPGQKWALENGTLTFTYLATNASDPMQTGTPFLSKNVKGPTGLSIGGQKLKRKALESLSPAKNTLLQHLKEECGIENLSVTVEDKLAEHYSYHLGHNPTSACDAGLQSIYNLCGRGDEFSKEYNKAAVKAAAQKHLKGISCVYADTESIAIKPGGILELGGCLDAPRPKWKGKTMMSIHDYYMAWLSANHASFSSGAPPSGSGTKKPKRN